MLIERNKTEDKRRLGVALGRLCIAKRIPVMSVASDLLVSRMTVYNWFAGVHDPQPAHAPAITEFIEKHK